MAIRQENFWTIFNRELAMAEQASAAIPDTSYTSFLKEGMEEGMRQRERGKSAVVTGINLLPQLAGLIRDEDSLANYENMSIELSKNASRYSETAPYAQFVKGVSSNLREDYNMYTGSMESAANLFKSDEYIDSAEDWDNLDDKVAAMTIEGTDDPKYQGNGTLLYLTDQQSKINSIIGRIENSSQGTQFRYNKAGDEYTDQEVLEKLQKHQQRIAIAVEAAYGDGIINVDEAELIMTGNLGLYHSHKEDALGEFDTEMKRMQRLQESISKQLTSLVAKKGKSIAPEIFETIRSQMSAELNQAQGGDEESQVIDTNLTSPDVDSLITDLQERQDFVYANKQKLKGIYKQWQGREYLQAPKISASDKEKFEERVFDPSVVPTEPLPPKVEAGEETVLDITKDIYEKEGGADVDEFISDWKDKTAIGAAGAYGLYKVSKGSIDYVKTILGTAEESKIAGFLQSPDAQRETQKIHSVIDKIKKLSPDDPNYSAKKQTYNKRIGKLASEFTKKHGHKFDASKDDIIKLMKNADKWNIWRVKNTVGRGLRQTYRTGEDLLKAAGKGGAKISPLTGALMGWHAGEQLGLGTAGKVATAYVGVQGTKKLFKEMGKKGWTEAISNPKFKSKVTGLIIKKAPWLGAKMAAKAGVGALTASTGVGALVSAGMAIWTISDLVKIANEIPEVKQLIVDYVEGKFDEE